MMSHIKVHSLTTYHILLAKSGELPMELYVLKIALDYQHRLTHLSFG
jgi:hypothetical protein